MADSTLRDSWLEAARGVPHFGQTEHWATGEQHEPLVEAGPAADAAVRVVLEHLLSVEPIRGLNDQFVPQPGFATQHAIATLLGELSNLEHRSGQGERS